MPERLLGTKLYVPRARRGLVARGRLTGGLSAALESKLTLLSAPAGFGKTTLLAAWVAAMPADTAAVAWLSLDADDNDASRFWRYIAAAIGRAAPETDIDAGSDSEAAPAPSPDDALPLLIHALSSYARPIVLVLDDYHVIERREIHEGMTFLLDHLPACLHVVLSSRADPQVPLARLRARGDLVEVRAADLRFRGDEASAYLNDVMGLGLAPADVDALEGRTEGWIAALHLAALSLRGRGDVSRYVRQLAGSSRYITDYLVEEVLERQPEAVRAFLLDTAILDRLCADLCDAVTGRDDGLAMLRSLEEGNVFLVALDDERRWFRYHHLFADVLRARIARERAHVRELHARASQWFELDGERPDAIRHALAADDAARAARLIEPAVLEMLRTRNEATLRAWLEALPDEVIEMRPVLSAGYAGMLLHSGTFATVEARLDAAERHLATATREVERTESDAAAPVFVDEEQFRTLAGMIALYRAGHAHVMGNGERTIAQARQALASMADDDPLRGGALALLGLALWSEGDLETASERYAEGIALVHAGGFVHDSSTIMLADMLVARGRLRDASRLYGTAIGRADALGGLAPRGSADLHIGASEICREQDDLDAALEHLAASREGGDAAGLPENRYRWFTAMAGISLARQDFEGAIVLLDDAARLYSGGFSPDVRPIAAQVARTQILQGRLDDAVAWASARALTPGDELSYPREFEHVTLARLLMARARAGVGTIEVALALLARILAAAEAGGRSGTTIEVLVLQALAYGEQGNTRAATAALNRALSLAEPEGYARVFIDEGAAMAALLAAVLQRGSGSCARRLLGAIQADGGVHAAAGHHRDELSERERDVIRLLATELSGPDIARELVVSLNTLRTHTKSIYSKLGVSSRRAAVRRATELGFL